MRVLLAVQICLLPFAGIANEPEGPPGARGQVLRAAQGYLKAELVNPGPQVAPTLCFLPPTQVRYSGAGEKSPHGGKLYYLFAKQRAPLAAKEERKAQPVGQYLVKESWAAEAAEAKQARPFRKHACGTFLSDRTTHKGKHWVAGDPLDLYIMLKLDPETQATDEGWVYAVVERDAKTIRHIGRIQSCIDCHEDAEHDRILGDYRAPPPLLPLGGPPGPSKALPPDKVYRNDKVSGHEKVPGHEKVSGKDKVSGHDKPPASKR